MLARVEREERAHAPAIDPRERASAPIVAPVADLDFEPHLPRDHPKWLVDRVSLSQRARALLETLRPVAIKILAFWDHRTRCAVVAGCRIAIDVTGSYRIE